MPNAEALFPALKNAEWATRDGNVYGLPLVWGDEPLVYDPATWAPEDIPAKYTGFSDPKWAGHLTMVDDPVANTWLWAKSLGHAEPARLTQEELDEVIDVMAETKPNVVSFATDLGDQADILIRGDATMGIGGWAYQKVLGDQAGKELAVGLPSEDGTYYWSDAYALAVDAPNECNAYAFMNFMMDPTNNAAMATALGSGATITSAVPLLDEGTKALYDYTIPRSPSRCSAPRSSSRRPRTMATSSDWPSGTRPGRTSSSGSASPPRAGPLDLGNGRPVVTGRPAAVRMATCCAS